MRFDELGLPTEDGASTYGDSARLAGLMILIGDDRFKANNILKYTKYNEEGVLVAMRHPTDPDWSNWKNFSRDQLLLLVAGMAMSDNQGTVRKLMQAAMDRGCRAQNTEKDVVGSTVKFPGGADLLSPSHMNHLRICSGEKPTILGKVWLLLDILFHTRITPLREPNQILSMCMVAGKFYVQLYKKLNPTWKEGIDLYWKGWRNEPELANRFKDVVESI